MNIVEITTFLRGGAGVFITRLSQSLQERGHQVHVVSSGQVDGLVDWEQLIGDLRQDGIPHATMNFFKRDHAIYWNEVRKLAQYLEQHPVDVIHAHAGVPALGAYQASRLSGKGIPLVVTFHSWGLSRPEWMNIQDMWAFNQAEGVYFSSKEYLRLGVSYGLHTPSDVIYPGITIEPEHYSARREQLRAQLRMRFRIPQHAKVITNLAEITQRKGQSDLVKAVSSILTQIPDVFLLFIGESRDEEYRLQMVQEIERCGLQNQVFCSGWVNDPYEYIAGSDLFAFPSYSEGLGMAITEAIALGIPAVFSYVEGMKDIADQLGQHQFGTFDSGDIEGIAAAILKVLSLDPSELAEKTNKASEIIRRAFSFSTMVSCYEAALLRACGKAGVE